MVGNSIRAVVFDLDDTLYYEKDYYVKAYEQIATYIAERNSKYNTFELYYSLIDIRKNSDYNGRRFEVFIEKNKLDIDVRDLALMYDTAQVSITMKWEAKKLLNWLFNNNYILILITNGNYILQFNKIMRLGIGSIFNTIIIPDMAGKLFWKPDSRLLERTLLEYKLDPKECLIVGNSVCNDIGLAINIGADYLLCDENFNKNLKYQISFDKNNIIKHLCEVKLYLYERH